MNTFTFLVTSLIIILMPGTGVIYTISTGISKGKKASIFASIGCTLGIIPHLISSIILSSLLIKMSNNCFTIIKILGTIYLVYLGVNMILSKSNLDFTKENTLKDYKSIVTNAILINLLNPKLTIFFFSFLPQYVSLSSKYYVNTSFLYGLLFMLITFIVFVVYGMLGSISKSILCNNPKTLNIIQKLFGVLFIYFAIKLFTSNL